MPHAERDGLRLYYERDGSGEPELLFVPGWCCDRTYFQPQFDYATSRGSAPSSESRSRSSSATAATLANGGH
jgi:hypothetical protein